MTASGSKRWNLVRAQRDRIPGLSLIAGMGIIAYLAGQLSPAAILSPTALIIGLVLAVRQIGAIPEWAEPGLRFTRTTLLRWAVVLLGFRITFDQIGEVWGAELLIVPFGICGTLLFFRCLGTASGIDRGLALLLAAGTAICGASAVAAIGAVSKSKESDVAYAVGCVTVFGTVLMLVVPAAGEAIGLDSKAIGMWAGGSIHEVAQAVAAGFSVNEQAGEFATVVKLMRVAALAPLICALSAFVRPDTQGTPRSITIPWFVVGFVLAILVRNVGFLPEAVLHATSVAASVLLCMAIGALTVQLDWDVVAARGFRPLLAGALGAVFIAGITLATLIATQSRF